MASPRSPSDGSAAARNVRAAAGPRPAPDVWFPARAQVAFGVKDSPPVVCSVPPEFAFDAPVAAMAAVPLIERLVEAVERGEPVTDAPGASSVSPPPRPTAPGAPGLSPTAMITALRSAFEETEAEILRQAVANRWRDGCTAVCALLSEDTLVVGNIGDSRAVPCLSNPNPHHSPLTTHHSTFT